MIANEGKATTEFMKFGDKIRIEMLDKNGKSIFLARLSKAWSNITANDVWDISVQLE